MRILCGSSVRIQPEVFKRYFRLLRRNEDFVDSDVDYFFVLDDEENEDDLRGILDSEGADYQISSDRPPDALYSTSGQTHDWSVQTFDHLARNKQNILDRAKKGSYDRVWLVDTDLFVEPTTLRSMLSLKKKITSGVFWTEWTKDDPQSLGPNVWLSHPYGQEGRWRTQPEFWERLSQRKSSPVIGGGACILIDTEVLDRVRYFPRLEGLPNTGMWQGEDRTFSILAQRFHIGQHSDPWPDIFHLYHPDQRTEEYMAEVESWLSAPRQRSAKYGDLISLTLENLSTKSLSGRVFPVRGRLGGLDLLPEIEAGVLEMEPGDERLMELHFPEFWPSDELRGGVQMARVRLVDVKEFGHSPVLAERLFRGIDAN